MAIHNSAGIDLRDCRPSASTRRTFLRTNPDGTGIVQAIGPLKTLAPADSAACASPSWRFLIVTDSQDALQVVLRQAP
jgi:hypothetical protein